MKFSGMKTQSPKLGNLAFLVRLILVIVVTYNFSRYILSLTRSMRDSTPQGQQPKTISKYKVPKGKYSAESSKATTAKKPIGPTLPEPTLPFVSRPRFPAFHNYTKKSLTASTKECNSGVRALCIYPKCLWNDSSCLPFSHFNEDIDFVKLQCTNMTENPVPAFHKIFPNPLSNAKYYTSWLFPKWRDFHPLGRVRTRVRSSQNYNGPRGIYELNRLCIRPMGGFIGYDPDIQPYRGFDRTTGDPTEFTNFIHSVQRLSGPPAYYYKLNAVLFPLGSEVADMTATFYRMGSLMRYINEVFPDGDNVTIIYVVLPSAVGILRSLEGRRFKNAVRIFHEIYSASYMAILAREESNDFLRDLFGSEYVREAMSVPLCIRRMYPWFYTIEDARELSLDAPGRQFQFGYKSPKTIRDMQTLQMFASRLLSCYNQSAPVLNLEHPRLLIAHHKFPGGMLLNPQQVFERARKVMIELGGRVQIEREGAEETFGTLDHDIFLVYGPPQPRHTLAPAGSIVVHITMEKVEATGKGPEKGYVETELVGETYLAGMFHIRFVVPEKLRAHQFQSKHFHFPANVVEILLRHAIKIIRRECVPCEIDSKELENAIDDYSEDRSGTELKYAALSVNSPYLSTDPFIKNSEMVAKVLVPYRRGKALQLLDIPGLCSPPRHIIGYLALFQAYLPSVSPLIFKPLKNGSHCPSKEAHSASAMRDIQALQKHGELIEKNLHSFVCEGDLSTSTQFDFCYILSNRIDLIVVDGSVVTATSLKLMHKLLGGPGHVIVLGNNSCDLATKTFMSPAGKTAANCGDGLVVVERSALDDVPGFGLSQDSIFEHIHKVLTRGKNTPPSKRIPALGLEVGVGELEALRSHILTFPEGIKTIHVFVNGEDKELREFLTAAQKYLRVRGDRFHVQFSTEFIGTSAAHNKILRSALQEDAKTSWVLFTEPNIMMDTASLNHFVTEVNEVLYDPSNALFTFCELSHGKRVYAHFRIATSALGYYDEVFYKTDGFVEYERRSSSFLMKVLRYERKVLHGFKQGQDLCVSPNTEPLKYEEFDRISGPRYDPVWYIKLKWAEGQKLFENPFGLKALKMLMADSLFDNQYKQCLRTGMGPKDSCGKCFVDIAAVLERMSVPIPEGKPAQWKRLSC